jgi:hypothetical protein
MKKATTRKSTGVEAEASAPLRALFLSFSKLAAQAAEGRPLLRGLRVAHDPKADRFVVVHAASRVEFVLTIAANATPARGDIGCRAIDSSGAAGAASLARFAFDASGVITESTVPELVNERIDLIAGASSVVSAVIWINMHAQV